MICFNNLQWKIGILLIFLLLIIKKVVIENDDFENILSIIYLQNKFNLDELYKDFPEYKDIIGSGGKEKRLTTKIFEQLSIFQDSAYFENEQNYQLFLNENAL